MKFNEVDHYSVKTQKKRRKSSIFTNYSSHKVKYKLKSDTKYKETRVSLCVWTKSSVHVVIYSAGQFNRLVTPSLIQHPPSSSAPACDSEWSLHWKKGKKNHYVRGTHFYKPHDWQPEHVIRMRNIKSKSGT